MANFIIKLVEDANQNNEVENAEQKDNPPKNTV